MINNKGFTLIELIASIGLILAIFMVAVPVSTNLIQNSNKKQCNNLVEEILTNAELYVLDHSNEYKDGFTNTTLELTTLYESGYIEDNYDFKNGYTLENGTLYDEGTLVPDVNIIITRMKDGVEVTETTTDGYNKYELSLTTICD